MPNSERKHFESYRLQTRVKHAILAGYLPAYFNVIKKGNKNLLYIDGFAGRGYYKSGKKRYRGSPLRALDVIGSKPQLAKRVQCVFIETDDAFVEELEEYVGGFYEENDHIKEPEVIHGRFAEEIDDILAGLDDSAELAPTFLFVDPCGVDNVSMQRIADVLSRDQCEVFIFLNIDGIRRIAGLSKLSPVLIDLYGSRARADNVRAAFSSRGSSESGEAIIVAHYRAALREDSGAEYFLPLRIESEHRATTSHYLVHATKHPLGFKIMKGVMWRRGGVECEGERLALLQASKKRGGSLFQPDLDDLRKEILAELAKGRRSVSLFANDWVCRPDDLFSTSVYKQQLLALEDETRIEVLDDDGVTPFPASKRRHIKCKPTLADRLFVRLK